MNYKTRMEKLERNIHITSCTATDESGRPFRIRRDDILGLACASFRRRYAEIEGEPQPVHRLDATLDALKLAAPISSPEPLLIIAQETLQI
jgi:hypothetical protein